MTLLNTIVNGIYAIGAQDPSLPTPVVSAFENGLQYARSALESLIDSDLAIKIAGIALVATVAINIWGLIVWLLGMPFRNAGNTSRRWLLVIVTATCLGALYVFPQSLGGFYLALNFAAVIVVWLLLHRWLDARMIFGWLNTPFKRKLWVVIGAVLVIGLALAHITGPVLMISSAIYAALLALITIAAVDLQAWAGSIKVSGGHRRKPQRGHGNANILELDCPHCSTLLSIPIPLPDNLGRCGTCGQSFRLQADADSGFRAVSIDSEP